jgi:chromosome condensin MukBEF ATPase and DNA-binding subunit MukB
VFSGDESSSSAFDMELLKAGLATVSTISRDHANLKGRVSRLEGKFEHWEEVLNQIKLCFPIDIDTNLKEEVEFLTGCSQTLLNSLKQQTNACGESNTYFRSKISELKKSMKIIGNKNVELQDTINSLRKAAERGGANFKSSLAELKNMQENFSCLQTEM